MDLNDPRLRIKVMKANSPSLRVASAPSQTLSIGKVNTPNIVVPKSIPGSYSAKQQPSGNFLNDAARNIGNFTAGANEQFLGGTIREAVNIANFLGSGFNSKEAEERTNDFLRTTGQTDRKGNFALTSGSDRNSGSFKIGQGVGTAEKIAADIATMALPGVAAEKAVANGIRGVRLLQGANMASRAGRLAIPVVSGGVVSSGISQLQDPSQNAGENFLGNAALDTGLSFAGPALSAFGRTKIGKTLIAGARGLLGKVTSKATDPIKRLAELTNPTEVKQLLGEKADKQLVDYIANESDPNAIKNVLSASQTESNVAQDTLPMLDPSRPTQAYLNENLPGTHVPGTPDPVVTISTKAKEFANVEDFKKYIDNLTGEEKAIAEAGLAGKSPEEFYSLVVGQLPPEDIAAIKEAGGVVPEKPKLYSPLDKTTMSKMDDLLKRSKETPVPDGHTRLYQTADDEASKSDQYFKDPDWLANHINNRSENSKLNFRDVPNESVVELPGKKGAVYKVDESKIAKASEDVSKTQTGASETKGVEPKAAEKPTTDGIKFRDPETKKQITRSYEDVQAEVEKLKNLPEEEVNAKVKARIKNLENKMYMYRSSKAKYSFPNASPEAQKAIQEVMDQLAPAQRQYNKVAKARTAEKATRISAGNSAFENAGGGEAGVRAKLSQLKGKYSESGFNPIAASETTQKTILDDIQNSKLREFEKLNTQNAMRKIWGMVDEKPTPSDINYIRKYFGDDMADSIEAAVEEAPDTWRDVAAKIAGTPRALMATGDLSFGGRQGASLGARYPKEWAIANKESVKYAVNKSYFEKEMKAIRDSDEYETIMDKMHVALTAADPKTVEEAFAAADYAEKIPVGGAVVRGSDRAYSGGLTKQRYEVAKTMINKAGGVDRFLQTMKEVYGDGKEADDAMKALGEVINTFTGRGGKAGGLVEQHMKTLSTTLFAPRLWASKLNSLNPYWYARLYKANPQAARMALETQGSFLAVVGTVLGLASAAGAEVVWDPRSADFAKIKVGNTRYDIMGGLQQNIRLAAQLITGTKINSITGEEQTLGDGYGKPTRYDILLQAFENKENPLLAFATKMLKGKDQAGNDINPLAEAAGLGIPLSIQGAYETAKDVGNIPKGILMNSPSFVGIGVQTYGAIPTKDLGKDSSGKAYYKGEIKDNMVTDNLGNVMLDDKGKPVTVKFDKNASEIEKKALKDEARRTAYKSAFMQKQTSEDKALMKLSDDELKQYVKDGTIDQAKFDKIQRLQEDATNYGKPADIPEGATSKVSKDFYSLWNKMNKTDQDKWLKEKPDGTAKSIATQLNKQRSKGLGELKPSNELSKLYSEFEVDMQTHPEYTSADKFNKAKEFQKKAYKLNYNTNQNDIYTEGSSSDLRTLIEEGQIDKNDLAAAIKMDDELYNSGLTGTLKFSKKFRAEFGFGLPGGYSGGSGGSGGSGSSVNQYLASHLPSVSASKAPAMPTFSSKPRTTGKIKFKGVNLPKSDGGSNIKINL